MIIRVNLLPRSFGEKRAVKMWTGVMAVSLIAVMVVMCGMLGKAKGEVASLTAEADMRETQAQKVTDLKAQAEAIKNTKVPGIKLKTSFVEDVDRANEQWATLLDTLSRYTYSKVIYKSVAPSTTAIEITGTADSVSSIGRYLLGMLRCKDFTYVAIKGMPGYPKGGGSATPAAPMPGFSPVESVAAPSQIEFQATCTLKEPLKLATVPGGGDTSTTGGGAGMGMMGGGGAPPMVGGSKVGPMPGGPPTP